MSQKKKKLKQEEKLNRHMIKYNGKVNYNTTLIDCATTCDDLLYVKTNKLFIRCIKFSFTKWRLFL